MARGFFMAPPPGAGLHSRVIRNIIFDWSGTLVDDLPAVLQASNHVFRMAGVPEMTREQFQAEFCLPFQRFYERYVPGVPQAQLEAWFHGAFRQCQHRVEEIPHAREFLEFCRGRGLRTFLLSSVHREHYAAQAAETGFGVYIEHPYVEVWDKRTKIREILQRHQLAPGETVFVGDMEHDIETAHHGGVRACAVLTGYNTLPQLRASHPDLIVEHLGELQEMLERQGFEWTLPPGRSGTSGVPVGTVGGLVFDAAGRVLLVRTRKWSGLWGIPGGKIRYGERAVDALRREVREETNLEVNHVTFVMVQDCIRSREFYKEAHFLLLNYTARCVEPAEVRLNAEAQDHRWILPKEALALDLNQPTRTLVRAVLDRRSEGL